MKRLVFLLAICLSFAAHAELMWQRNNGVWEAVVRVSKEEPVWEIGDFRAVTNGLIRTVETIVSTSVVFRVEYEGGRESVSDKGVSSWYSERWHDFAVNYDGFGGLVAVTNRLAGRFDACTFLDISPVKTNISVKTIPHQFSGDLPCRFGVPQTITVNPPYTDLLEMLPLDWPETYIRIRTGFDGYLLIRFDEREMRLTIKRLLPEKLPYEHPRRNIRVLRDDLLNGV